MHKLHYWNAIRNIIKISPTLRRLEQTFRHLDVMKVFFLFDKSIGKQHAHVYILPTTEMY